jgi:hypothetical protein
MDYFFTKTNWVWLRRHAVQTSNRALPDMDEGGSYC